MTEKELWDAFITNNPHIDCAYTAWAFGVEADRLAHLVERGQKTATSSAHPLYELENEPLPAVGEYSVILDSDERPVCIIQTTRVAVIPFCEVTAEHAYKEGEGDKSLAYWREVHRSFFTDCLDEVGLEFSDDMKVVCEEFRVVYKQ